MTEQSVDGNVPREEMRIEVEQSLCTQISSDVVSNVDDSVIGKSKGALGVTHKKVLIRVAVSSNVRLEVAPAERRELQSKIRNDAVVLGCDLVLVDVEVRVVYFSTLSQCGKPASLPGGRQIILRILVRRPHQESDERTAIAFVRLPVVRI